MNTKNKLIRLNKYIANSGVCSRRDADLYISTGIVKVNNEIVTTLGKKVNITDIVTFDGKTIIPEKKSYILLNKPKGFITTTRDEKNRKTVMNLIKNATTSRVVPVGRLDRNTTGLLLFSNDGTLAKKLTHPRHNIKKLYEVILNKKVSFEDFEKIKKGIELDDGFIKVDKLNYVLNKPKNYIGIEIHSGKNRIVRRIFEYLGYEVFSLDRVVFANLTKKNLPRGTWRELTKQEIINLQML